MLALIVTLLSLPGQERLPAPPSPEVVAEALAADVICGEAGRKDEYMASLVAAVISNRMRELGNTRAERVTRVLRAKRQFNGSCRRRGLEPTEWHRYLAGVLVRGDHAKIARPAWLTADVKFFSERRTARRWMRRLERAGVHGGMWFFRERRRKG